jgi:predicted phosphodiesterase
VHRELSDLYARILKGEEAKGLVIPFDIHTGRFIIFSDQHKGGGNGADDFLPCEPVYLGALDYYYQQGYHLIALGDNEELWENTWPQVKKAHPLTFEKEARFIPKNALIKVFGNHDLFWDNDPFAPLELKKIYGEELPIHEGVVLKTTINNQEVHIFCTHGHQGDKVSDGNWFSKFFVSRIWGPLQSYLRINPNTPAYDAALKTKHNALMYQWSAAQKNLLLVTGHTHQPVFESLTHIERLYRQLLFAHKVKDEEMINSLQATYFNAGCCCYSDGDITGIEIEENCLRLVKWKRGAESPQRVILEEAPIEELLGLK